MRKQEETPRQRNIFIAVLALVGACGVVAGAFGSHALRHVLDDHLMEVWRTAVLYLFVHTLVAIFCEARFPNRGLGGLFLAGVAIFSGSLFVLCLSGWQWLGAVTPIGGVLFIVAWLRAAWLELRQVAGGGAQSG